MVSSLDNYIILCNDMGEVGTMVARKRAIKELEIAGYVFGRHGGNHDIYINAETGAMIPLKRHDFDESDLRVIRKEIEANRKP